MELTDELKKEFQTYSKEKLNDAFVEACQEGYVNIVKYLLTSTDLEEHADVHADEDYGFRGACQNGHLDVVKYLLTSQDLQDHTDIHVNDNDGFRWACAYGHLDVVKYLLTSPDLKEHADIHARDDYGFRLACTYGHLEIVKYLLTSPALTEYADIHAGHDRSFKWACKVRHLEIIIHLLSFNGKQCINFQCTKYTLNWAIENKLDDIIIAMMKNLKNNDFMQYVECLPKIEAYDKALYEEIKKIVIEECLVNPNEEVLYL